MLLGNDQIVENRAAGSDLREYLGAGSSEQATDYPL